MEKPTRTEVNCKTGQVQITELSSMEIEEMQLQRELAEAMQAEQEAEQAAILAAKESAKSKLAKLGLTEEEIKALTNN